MQLKLIEFGGFGPYKYPVTIEFNKPFYLITGDNKDNPEVADSNEAGKTMILHAIIYGLFGTTPNKPNKKTLINYNTSMLSVMLIFNDGTNNLSILRTLHKDSKSSEVLWYEYSNDNFIIKSSKVEDDVRKTQKDLEDILQTNFDLFISTHYIGRGAKALQFIQLSPIERMKLIEHLFTGDAYKKAQPLVYQNITELTNNLNIEQERLNTFNMGLSSIETKITECAYNLNTLQVQKSKNIFEFKQIIKTTKDKIENKEEAIKDIKKTILTKQQEISDTDNKIFSFNNDLSLLQKDLSKYNQLTGKNKCPLCNSFIENIDYINKIKQDLDTQIKSYMGSIKSLTHLNLNRKTELTQHKNNLRIIEDELSDLNISLIQTESQLFNLNDTSISIYEGQLEEYRQEKRELQITINNKKQQIIQVENDLEYHRFWHKAFSPEGIRTMLLKNMSQSLTNICNYWVSKFLGNAYTIIFPEDTSKGLDIKLYQGSEERSLALMSTGCLWRLNFSILLAISSVLKSKTSFDIDLLLIDDIFGDLDNTGRSVILNLIDETLIHHYGTTLVTAPDSNLDGDLIVYKDKGTSIVKQGGSS